MMTYKRIRRKLLSILLLTILAIGFLPQGMAAAEEARAVSIGRIDYEDLTIQIFKNNNSMVYYSTDKTTWIDVDAPYDSTTGAYVMDISWISDKSDYTLYFRGNAEKTIIPVTLPEKNNSFDVDYDVAEDSFTFTDCDETDTFEWRKSADYYWNKVDIDENSASYKAFMDNLESFRAKGIKLNIRIPQIMGKDSRNTGSRPSKEITITIAKRPNAPSVKVNSSKLNLNTTEAMEYYDSVTKLWMECSRTMLLEEVAPEVLYANGSKSAVIIIRTAATDRNTYSKSVYLTVKGQKAAPVIGGNTDDVTYYYMNNKLMLQFNKASKSDKYEYAVVKPGYDFDVTTARWISVASSSLMTISQATVPDGSVVCVRKCGIDENAGRNIELLLSSDISSFTANYPG